MMSMKQNHVLSIWKNIKNRNELLLKPMLKSRRLEQLLCRNISVTHSLLSKQQEVKKPVVSEENEVRPEDIPREEASPTYFLRKQTKLKEPFVKDLFLGKVNHDFFVFPEITNEELQNLNELIAPIERFFETVDSKSIDENAKIPEEVLQQIKDLGLFGLQIPDLYGGLNLGATEYARIAEITALDGSIAVTLAAHQAIGFKGILLEGNDEQKQKYLPRLATGELTAAFCLTEPSSGSDAASIQCRATLSEDGKRWILNGSKIWISNGGIADLFTVFARTEFTAEDGSVQDKITGFIVERDFGGVTSGQPEHKLGIRGSNTTEVNFDNTPVPAENMIGEIGSGFKLAMRILNGGRFSMGSSAAGVLKKLLALTTEHATTRNQFGQPLSNFGLIQEKLAKIASTIYAMESMSYLTAGILDKYDDPDMSNEAAIVKIFSSEGSFQCVSECLQIMGGMGYMREYPFERYLRDSRIMLIFEGTNEILRLFIALNGMKHAGQTLKEIVKKMRDPFNNLGMWFRMSWNMYKKRPLVQTEDLNLFGHVHPLLDTQARELEKDIVLFNEVVTVLLKDHGNNIVNEQMKLRRVADIVIDLYAAVAVFSRGNRAYSTGMANCKQDMLLAKAFWYEADQRIKRNLFELKPVLDAKFSVDDNHREIAEEIFKKGGYSVQHPLQRNF